VPVVKLESIIYVT